VDGLDALLQSINGVSYIIDPCSLQQLRIISVQVMAEMESVDEYYQLFRIGGEFLGSYNTALRYTAVHSVDLGLLIIMVGTEPCHTDHDAQRTSITLTKTKHANYIVCDGVNVTTNNHKDTLAAACRTVYKRYYYLITKYYADLKLKAEI